MMKYLLTILTLILTISVKGQCDTTTMYNIPIIFDMKMNTDYWDYYNPGGVLAWKRVKGFDSTLIPTGGFARMITVNKTVEGYGTFKVVDMLTCEIRLIRLLDNNYKDIKGFVSNYYFKR